MAKQKNKKKKIDPPNIFLYDNYRDYLRDYMAYRKKLNSSFSLRSFAIQAGIKAHSTLHMVMDGKKNLSRDMTSKCAKIMKLKKNEMTYFSFLIDSGSGRYLSLKSTIKSRTALLILPLIGMPGFRPDPEWISKRTNGFLKEGEIRKTLVWMKQKEMIFIDNGRWATSSNAMLFNDDDPSTSEESCEYSYKLYKHAQKTGRIQADYTLKMNKEMMNQFSELLIEFLRKTYVSLFKEYADEIQSDDEKHEITSAYNVCIQVAEVISPLKEKKKKSYLQ